MSVFDQVKKIVMDKCGAQDKDVTEEARFVEDLGLDSLDAVELVMAIEGNFEIAIPDEDTKNLLTVGDLVNYITTKTNK